MLRATAGSRLYIGSAPVLQHRFDTEPMLYGDDLAWTEVCRLEALGTLVQEWTTQDLSPMGENPAVLTVKAARRGAAMQVVMGIEDADPGQLRLFDAYHDPEAYPFRLTFSDEPGSPERRWLALVISMGEQLDNASSVMKRVVDLTLTSTVLHL